MPIQRPDKAFLFRLTALAFLAQATAQEPDWSWKEGRTDIVLLDRGEVSAAIDSLTSRLERLGPRGEIFFALAAAHAQAGDLKRALRNVDRALDIGLPLERFVAGPRKILGPLQQSEAFRKLVESSDVRLVHGPLVGSVTDRSARFWVRTAAPYDVRVDLRESESPADGWPVRSSTTRSREDREHTAIVETGDLKADTAYDYRLLVDGEPAGGIARFRTFPRAGEAASFRIVFGGGAAFTPETERVFETIRSREPLAFLQLGDNVYIDQPKRTAVQEYCYYRRQSSLPYRRLVASTCVAAIWDDHDFSTNDSWGGPGASEPSWKPRVWRTFRNNWNNPAYGGGNDHPGCYFDFQIADVHFVLLDCRYYRTDPRSSDPSMLGPVQKRWLLDTLKRSTGTFKVIASSVPFASGVKPGSADPWDGFPAEREEIFTFIEEQRIGGVVLIAADRHRSDAWRIARPGSYDLHEFQSSRLTNIHRHRVMPDSLFGFNEDRSFGELEFDTGVEDPTVTYTIFTIDGKKVWSITLRRGQLEPQA